MDHWLDNTWQRLQFEALLVSGEALLVGGVEKLFRGWKTSSEAIGKLWPSVLWPRADRWHAAIHEIQAQVNLADVLRARSAT